jgi:hypothetical protein
MLLAPIKIPITISSPIPECKHCHNSYYRNHSPRLKGSHSQSSNLIKNHNKTELIEAQSLQIQQQRYQKHLKLNPVPHQSMDIRKKGIYCTLTDETLFKSKYPKKKKTSKYALIMLQRKIEIKP